MEDYSEIIAKNLISLRKTHGLTQQDFAKLLNYSDKTISKWELAYAIPSVDTLKQIADYYGVTVDYFLCEHEEVSDKNIRLISRGTRRILIMSLFDLFFILAAVVVFVALSTTHNPIYYWPCFIWGVAGAAFYSAVWSNQWWKHTIWPYIFTSLTIWSILFGVYSSLIYSNVEYNFWYLFFLGLPVQFAAIIILTLTHTSSK